MIKRVLVINDAHDTLQMVQEALSYEHFEVNIVPDSEEVFSVIEQFRPDLLIIDHRLTINSCCDICHRVKASKNLPNTSVIICSAYVQRENDCIIGCDCDAVIAKPFGLQELLDTVNELIPG